MSVWSISARAPMLPACLLLAPFGQHGHIHGPKYKQAGVVVSSFEREDVLYINDSYHKMGCSH